MRSIARVCILLLIPSFTLSGWQTAGNADSLSFKDNEIRVRAGKVILFVTILAPDLVRVRCAPRGAFSPDQSWAVVKKDWTVPDVEFKETADSIVATSNELSVIVTKRPLRIGFADRKGRIINRDDSSAGISWNGTEVKVSKEMPQDEHYYGLGEKAGSFERRSSHTTMWNSDIPGYKADTDPLYQSIPFFYGLRNGNAYGIFFDNSFWSSFDFGKECRDKYSFGAENGEINYYFFYGPSPSKVLARYSDLVGRMPLPPLWALGYQQCRWSYAPESRVREIARGFRDRKIPCDVIYLDIDYMEGYRIFTWNNVNFPNPKKMISDLRQQGFRVAVIVDPGIKEDTAYVTYQTGLAGNHFLKYPDGRIFIGKVWPGKCAFPDFTSASTRKWWGNSFSVLVDAGVRGWWNDMNEPSVFDVPTKTIDLSVVHNDDGLMSSHARNHNIYGMEMTRATYDGVRSLLPNERPFVLTRASFAGGQRYSSTWTGDNVASWEHLQMAVPMCLSLSISGQPFVGSDIGGFIGYPGGELFARWLQFGVFTPLMRAHSVINEKNKEPWEYGDEFTEINREAINLRYMLLPYIYNTMHNASISGIPPMQPMIFAFPEEHKFALTNDQFMFGPDLLIAPVLSEGARTREVRLPSGVWYDFWKGTKYNGSKTIVVDAPVDRIPILVREGAMIPTRQSVQYTDEEPINPLTVSVYPTSRLQANSNYYEDDGHTFDYQKGKYLSRTLNQWNSSEALTITVGRQDGSYQPPARTLEVKVRDFKTIPTKVEYFGESLDHSTFDRLKQTNKGWTFEENARTVIVRLPDTAAECRIVIKK